MFKWFWTVFSLVAPEDQVHKGYLVLVTSFSYNIILVQTSPVLKVEIILAVE